MADVCFTMRPAVESWEEKLLTKLVCFLRTGDFVANSPRITVDLVVVSSLEGTRTLLSCTFWCWLDESLSGFVQAAIILLMCVILGTEESRKTSPHTHRFSLISKKVNGWKVVLLNYPQTVSLIPAIRKHVKADLTSCRKAAKEISFYWTLCKALWLVSGLWPACHAD